MGPVELEPATLLSAKPVPPLEVYMESHFDELIAKVLVLEGEYSNDPDDSGGETIRGIARNFNSDWHGWEEVDRRKSMGLTPYFDGLEEEIREFYRQRYWAPFNGDQIGTYEVADRMLDIAINLGTRSASRMLQHTLNLLNRDGASWDELIEDGLVGPKTLECLDKAKSLHVCRVLEVLQGRHYVELVESKPSQEKFLRGWLARIHRR